MLRTALLSCAVVAAFGCGGKVIYDPNGSNGGAGGATGSTSSTHATTTNGTTNGTGVGTGATTSGSPTSTGVVGSSSVGETNGAGGAGVVSASIATSVSSSTGMTTTIECGASTCDAATQACCATMGGESCISKGGTCGGVSLDCSSADSCMGGEVCCGVGGMGTFTAQCAPKCMGPGGGLQLCTTSTECLHKGDVCTPGFGGFSFCNGMGGPPTP